MSKIRTSLVAAAVAVAMVVPVLGTGTQKASAQQVPCGVYPSAKKLQVNDDKTITGYFEIKGDANCEAGASVMVWNADPSLFFIDEPKPEFWTTQTVYDIKSGIYTPGEYSFTVKLPVCESDKKTVSGYQADVIADANPPRTLTPPGAGGWWDGRQANGGYLVLDAKVAGDKCPVPVTPEEKPPVVETPVQPVPVPEAPQVPEAPVEETPVVEETLPAAGAGSVLAIGGLVSAIAAVGYNVVLRRRSAKA